MKILAVGDMHLGRTPSRLAADLLARELGPAAAWRRTVDAAIEHEVAAVLLAGDVVDRDDDFFEAYRALEEGVRRLTEAGIEVVGVAGNHDLKVLPRLAEHIPAFRLLGRNGTWEPVTVSDGLEIVAVWGWSFPAATAASNPLADQRFTPEPGINLGLLHCDRDGGTDSRYAPVSSAELSSAGLDAWLLGHIHKPDALAAATPNGYLGSLTGLDRGETGPRGPWLITVDGGHITEFEHLLLAPLRWETLDVDLAGIAEPEDAQGRLLDAVKALDTELAALESSPRAVGLSVTLAGSTRFGTEAHQRISQDELDDLHPGAGGTRYFAHCVTSDTRPQIDLGELARRHDPVGLLAARLLLLDRPDGDPERERLVNKARRRLRNQSGRSRWSRLKYAGDDALDPAAWLRQAGFRALDQLLAQQRHGEQDAD